MKGRFEETLRPFGEKESAAAWLAEDLSRNGHLTTKAMYALEMVTKLTSNDNEKTAEIFRRLPADAVAGGCQQGGSKNTQASLLLRGSEGAGGKDPVHDHSPEKRLNKEQLLEEYARAGGFWFEDADAAVGESYEQFGEGGEARVFYANPEHDAVIKVINSPGLGGVQMLMDRITLHNYLFPETNMTVIGFGRSPEGHFSVIVTQPYIRGLATRLADAAKMVTGAGFHLIDGVRIPYTFFTDEYCLGDLHERNVLTDEDGDLNVIDCDVRVNEPHLGYGGKWIIPPVEGDAAAVRQIDDILDRLAPRELDTQVFCQSCDEGESVLSQLSRTGRVEGPVSMERSDGGFVDVCACLDADEPGKVLVLSCESVLDQIRDDRHFSMEEKGLLAYGYTVKKNGFEYAFNLSTGRIEAPRMLEGLGLKESVTKGKGMKI